MPARTATSAAENNTSPPRHSSGEPTNLTDLIERMSRADPEGRKVDIGEILDTIGQRSFAPVLVVMGLIVVSPLSGIPGMPSTIGLLVTLISIQLVFGKRSFWLPQWMRRRGISQERYQKALAFMGRPARVMDRWLKPRLEFVVSKVGFPVILSLCIIVAITMPVMEPVPFAASLAGVALVGFGLSLLAHDGLVALISIAYTLTAVWLVATALT